MHQVVPYRKKVSNICYNHNHGNHSNLTDSKLPLPLISIFLSWQLAAISCLVHHFRHTFAMQSVTYTYIFWPSILHKGIYWIVIFTLDWYWCIHGYFLSLTQIQNGCHTVVGLTITFKLNFMYSNMTPRFLCLNNFIILIVFMKFRVIFCHI